MRVPVHQVLRDICSRILEESKTPEQWALVESDDMFQGGPFVGGYDADEAEFCFSYYADDGGEYWFQFSLAEAARIASGGIGDIEMREPE